MKVLFVDNRESEYKRFLELPFAKDVGSGNILFRNSPVGLPKVVSENPELRLVILDMLWEQSEAGGTPIELGEEAARELLTAHPDVPVIIYSIMDDETRLRRLIPEMIRIGAYDWVGKDEPRIIRSFRFERAFREGRDRLKRPGSYAVLPPDQQTRSDVHVAILFVDMSGFTALTNEIGGPAVQDILRKFYALVGSEILRNGGYIDKYVGDEVMAIFGAVGPEKPDLSRHGRQCIDTALSIQAAAPAFKRSHIDPILEKRNLQLTPEKFQEVGRFRIGMESGLVEISRFERGNESEVTVIGKPVNIAARIIGQAAGGEIWAGSNLHRVAVRHGEVVQEEEGEYKGLPGPYRRYRLRT
jgi:class 3 adenylate cyclase